MYNRFFTSTAAAAFFLLRRRRVEFFDCFFFFSSTDREPGDRGVNNCFFFCGYRSSGSFFFGWITWTRSLTQWQNNALNGREMDRNVNGEDAQEFSVVVVVAGY